jgi:hypothetical protein
MALDDRYLVALKGYLEDQYVLDPPDSGTVGLVKCGKLQESPEDKPAVITLHIGDTASEDTWNEMITEQERQGGGSTHQLLGGYNELGGGALYWYRFTAQMRYFLTRTPADQVQAQAQASEVFGWLRRKIKGADATALALTPDTDETFLYTVVNKWQLRESGGPPASYIWRGTIRFSALVYLE